MILRCIFSSGHTTVTLDDARVFANHAKKKNIDVDDVKLAIQMHAQKMSSSGPPRDVSLMYYFIQDCRMYQTLHIIFLSYRYYWS